MREMACDVIDRGGNLLCRKCSRGGICNGIAYKGVSYEGFGSPSCVECGRELTRVARRDTA